MPLAVQPPPLLLSPFSLSFDPHDLSLQSHQNGVDSLTPPLFLLANRVAFFRLQRHYPSPLDEVIMIIRFLLTEFQCFLSLSLSCAQSLSQCLSLSLLRCQVRGNETEKVF